MRTFLLIFGLAISSLSFGQKGQVVLNDSASVAFVSQVHQLQGTSPVEISGSELYDVILLTERFSRAYNKDLKSKAADFGGKKNVKRYKIKSLDHYRIQVVSFVNSNGEKEIWINGFCNRPKNWRHEIMIVFDGGNCYFSMRINLTTKTLISASTNGYS